MSLLFLCTLKYSSHWVAASNSALQLFKIPHLNRPSSTPLFAFIKYMLLQGKWHLLITTSQLFCWQLFFLEQCIDLIRRVCLQISIDFRSSFALPLMRGHTSQFFRELFSFSVREVKTYCTARVFQRNEERSHCLTSLQNIEWSHSMPTKIPACPKSIGWWNHRAPELPSES